MNSQFKLNLLNSLSNKKANKGFTLIELLVVVIIIGVLAAIALPNLLGQVGKARESEAKSQVGAVNRAQQAYYTEYSDFAVDDGVLEMPLPPGKYYTFDISNKGITLADDADNDRNNTRDYVGGVAWNTDDREFSVIVCRADEDQNAATGLVSNPGIISGANTVVQCAGNSKPIK